MRTDFTITVSDLKRLGYCNKGARKWFESVGLDWNAFVKNGLPADVVLAKGDGMSERLVRVMASELEGKN